MRIHKIKILGTLVLTPVAIIPCSTILTGCSNKPFIDYSNSDNYIYHRTVNNAKYDVIYFVGSCFGKQTQDNGVAFDAKTLKENGFGSYATVGSQLCDKDSNIFVPLYRQMSLGYAFEHYSSHDDIINDLKEKEPYQDFKNFFDYYFSKVNVGGQRPFAIAGHSQGGASVQAIIEKYFLNGGHKAYLKNLIAAYSIGYGVSEKWYNKLDRKLDGKDVLHFATGANDTNCLISWNTEGPDTKTNNILIADEGDKGLVINPLNWSTTSTERVTSNHGILLWGTPPTNSSNYVVPDGYYISTNGEEGGKGERKLMDAQLDLTRGSVICTSNTDYVGDIWGGQSLHGYDGSGYYVNMSENIQTRLQSLINKKRL